MEENKERLRIAVGTMFWPITLISATFLLISIFQKQVLAMLIFDDVAYAHFIPLTFIWVLINTLLIYLISFKRARGQLKEMAVVNTIAAILKIAELVLLANHGYNMFWIICIIVATDTLIMIVIFSMIAKDIGLPSLHVNIVDLRKYCIFSIPQIPSVFLLWIISYSDRFFITHYLGIDQSGIYSVSYAIGNLIYLFFMPIGVVLFPILAKFWGNGEISRIRNYFEISLKVFLLFSIPSVIGLFVISDPLTQIIATSEYIAGSILVFLIALGVMFYGIYNLNAYLILLNQNQVWWLPLVAMPAIISICMNSLLIPRIGIIGAGISNCISLLLLATATKVWANRVVEYSIDNYFILKIIIATIFMWGCIHPIMVNTVYGLFGVISLAVLIYTSIIVLLRTFSHKDLLLIRESITR
jgi:O-antigen/teichoic acid export membrane protein